MVPATDRCEQLVDGAQTGGIRNGLNQCKRSAVRDRCCHVRLQLVAAGGEGRLLRLSQVAFSAAFMLIVIPKEPTDLDSEWPFWTAFALLLLSLALTVAHKRRRKLLSDSGPC